MFLLAKRKLERVVRPLMRWMKLTSQVDLQQSSELTSRCETTEVQVLKTELHR